VLSSLAGFLILAFIGQQSAVHFLSSKSVC
jgi:hypothetical protein